MRLIYCIIFSFLLPTSLWAQYSLSGRVLDQESQAPLPGASIQLFPSSQYALSNEEGEFTISKLKAGDYRIKVSFLGFKNYSQEITITGNQSLDIQLTPSPFITDEVVVRSTRVRDDAPLAFQNISREELQAQNLGQDLPILLNFTPSLVSTSDAGAGVGYTGLRIRGSDATRINVSINGIPLNDAESQGVFWVNMPDFASSVESIQIQRGVGTSTNGAGAFGASINIQTNQLREDAYAEISNSVGSFNTWKHTLRVGSGLINNKFTLDARLSKVSSDGFIDRAFSDLKSFYLAGAYYGKNTLIRANVFSGQEQTFQAWYGVPEARLRGDQAGMLAYAERNFLNEAQTENLLNSDSRRYNSQLYDNETDNYQQDHYQFFLSQTLANQWDLNLALHYTRGEGYFEQYRYEDDLATYGIDNVLIGNEEISNSDLIRRRWLDNHFYGAVFSMNKNGDRAQWTLGGAWNEYRGRHFGEVIWARFAGDSEIRDNYYDNDAIKGDFNLYAKVNYDFNERLNGYLDLQYRRVGYDFLGNQVDNQGFRNVQQDESLHFFNPKFGLNFSLNEQSDVYASLSVGQKEPNRDDYTQSTAQSRPKAEKLYDIELGFRQNQKKLAWALNAYAMLYQDQLILNGSVNDVGSYNRINVDRSYRIGLEAELNWAIDPKLNWSLNATFSQNKIQNFREFVDFFPFEDSDQAVLEAQGYTLDPNSGQLFRDLDQTDIAFSPNLIAASQLEYRPWKGLRIALLSKYVGEQFLDNSSSDLRKLEAYLTQDLRVIYEVRTSIIPRIQFSLLLNNLSNEKFESNGYTFGYFLGQERISENFYFPQAGTNFLMGLSLFF